MEDIIKAVSFRIGENDVKRFRELAEKEGLNQAEMFQSIINSFELGRAKEVIKDRGKEIEVFQDTVNKLVSMFINSLSVNQTSEERIRESLSLELKNKEYTISKLQEDNKTLNEGFSVNNKKIKKVEKEYAESTKQLEELKNELSQKVQVINNQNQQIKYLTDAINEIKEKVDNNKDFKAENLELKNKLDELTKNEDFLKARNKNFEDMVVFYKEEISNMRTQINSKEQKLKEVEEGYKNQIDIINEKHEKAIKELKIKHEEEIKKLESEFDEKISLEKEKLMLEIERMNTKHKEK